MYEVTTDLPVLRLGENLPQPKYVEKLSVRKKIRKIFLGLLLISDVLMLLLGYRIAYYVRFQLDIPLFKLQVTPSFSYYQRIYIVFILVLLIIYFISGLYDWQNLLGGFQEYSIIFNATSIGMLLIITAGFIFQDFIYSRGWLFTSWVMNILLICTARFLLRRVAYFSRKYGYFLHPALIVGANEEGRVLAEQLSHWKSSGFFIRGFADNKLTPGESFVDGLPCLGYVDQLDQIIEEYKIEEIILASSAFSSRDHMLEIFKRYGVCKDINVRFSSGLYEIITTGMTVKNFCYVPLVGIDLVRFKGIDKAMKTLLEYSLVIPGIILALPLMIFIAIAIKLDSPGGIIYRRRVMGVNGSQFDAYKFRTMHKNGKDILDDHPLLKKELAENHKLKQDPRVTRVGRFLRKYSLDEIPQLFNILKGEMALVGPRMISPTETEMYEKWDMNLLTVRPGITGFWQVSGRSDVSYQDRVRKDMYYIRNWNIFLDLQIIIQTIPVMIKEKALISKVIIS